MKDKALLELYNRIVNCRCPCPGERTGAGLVRDRGNLGARIVFLGEAPGGEEIKQGMPFVGQAGRNLDEYLSLAGLGRSDVFITNAIKCRPTQNDGRSNRKPRACEIKHCAHWLDEELALLSPRVIVALGDVALKRLIGGSGRIGNCHGQPFELEKYIVFPMYHPAASIYRRALVEVIQADFKRLGVWLQEILN
ncbi:uracil-DNA glycosylase [Desulfoscipio gibsoniae]|uniref:Type-4 uracil-DNA glycosylase n=1 Tax=Desulfoscipio gibsoniae DSM 7213 TaxID=767817 RepID=R4KRR4_9FIRM|nr:uracil-DNA glycosylase [Desulfoscipio gibsoniae]AGL03270.1 uracil-DNA glycosylase, family 4 [Desulfoscipio gibsoniae DSM 7213]